MTTFSKLFSEKAKTLTCKDLFHPEFESCTSFLWYFFRTSVIQCLKYLGPILFVPLTVKFRRTTLQEWIEKTDTYLRMAFGMSATIVCGFSIHCFLNKMIKPIRYLNMTAVPAFITTMLFVNYFPAKFANLQFLFINNLLVQTILRTSEWKTFQMIRESKTISTALFMTFSSLIMGLVKLTRGEKHRYWYAQEFEIKKVNDNSEPNSEDAMDAKVDLLKDLVQKQIMSTVKVALLMSSIKIISNSLRLLKKSFFEFMVSFMRNFDYKLLGFFALYGTSFQVFYFLLDKLSKKTDSSKNSFLAGFLAGSAFYLSPRYFLFTYAFTTLSELLMGLFLQKSNQRSKITKSLRRVSWLKTFLCVSIATFAHWRIFYPWLIPKFMEQLMHIGAIDRLALGSQNYAKYILGI